MSKNFFQLTIDQPGPNLAGEQQAFDRQAIVGHAVRQGFDQIVESSHEISEEVVGLDPDLDDRFDGRIAVVVYSADEGSLESLGKSFVQALGPSLRCVVQAIPAAALQNPWTNGDWLGFTAGAFRVEVFDGIPSDQTLPVLDSEGGEYPNIIRIVRGNAFGMGNHASTRACLAALAQTAPEASRQGSSCLDIGTGNGILLIAANQMGFHRLVGTDIEDEILSEARRNLLLNRTSAELLCQEHLPAGRFDLVTCNILFPLLHQMLEDMIQHVSASGKLLLGGFPEMEMTRLQERLAQYGFKSRVLARELNWPCLVSWRGEAS